MDANQDRRRGHFHRSRRGQDRRGFDRRAAPQPQATPARDQVEVEQIMREIRARIAQRQGVELSNQQIDDLAARRLEYILDPRAMKPEFLDTLRRSADGTVERQNARLPPEPVYVFEDTTLYDSHRAILRFVRKLFNPLLKLLFNPNPLIRALHLQAKLNVEAAERDAVRDRRQAEWNALHYAIVQRLVTEVSRLSLELQTLSTRIESLAARVDFADRRVRAIEGTVHQIRPGGRPQEAAPAARPPEAAPIVEGAPEAAPTEGARRRRRRRRGRRGAAVTAEGAQAAGAAAREPELTPEPELIEEDADVVEGVDAAAGLDTIEEPAQMESTAWAGESTTPSEPPATSTPLSDVDQPSSAPPPVAEHDDEDRRE